MNPNSYVDKTFVANDPDARVRQDDLVQFEKYKAGDQIPTGKSVGDVKIVPVGTEVKLTAAKVGALKRPFVFAEPAAGGAPFGWTAASNFRGKLINETIGLLPARGELSFRETIELSLMITPSCARVRPDSPQPES